MQNMEKLFQIAGHRIRVRLEAPWTFKALTPAQEELVEKLRQNNNVGPSDKTDKKSFFRTLFG